MGFFNTKWKVYLQILEANVHEVSDIVTGGLCLRESQISAEKHTFIELNKLHCNYLPASLTDSPRNSSLDP